MRQSREEPPGPSVQDWRGRSEVQAVGAEESWGAGDRTGQRERTLPVSYEEADIIGTLEPKKNGPEETTDQPPL